jgi:tetratricopeptide (TPR) repeat protein
LITVVLSLLSPVASASPTEPSKHPERGNKTTSSKTKTRESLAIKREIGDVHGEGTSLNNLGNIALQRGNIDSAELLYREALAIKILHPKGDAAGELSNLGNIAKRRGDISSAERLYRESLEMWRADGNLEGEAHALVKLGSIMYHKGQHDEEHRMYTEAVRIHREIGIPIEQWFIDNGY